MFSKDKRESEPPPRPQRPVSRSTPPSIISVSLRIVGNLVSDGDIQIDGIVDGDVQSRSLTVSQGATVNGGITGETVRIDGTVHGQIKASNVTLGPTAHVQGDIVHTSLVVEAGAFVEGHMRRMEAETAPVVVPIVNPVIGDAPPLYGAVS